MNGLEKHVILRRRLFGSEKGSTMVAALWVTMLLTIMGAVTALTAVSENRTTGAVHRGKLGLYSSESGLFEAEQQMEGKLYTDLAGMNGVVSTNRAAFNWDTWTGWQSLPENNGRFRGYMNPDPDIAVIEILPEGSQVSKGRTAASPYDQSWGATKLMIRSVGTGKTEYASSVQVHLDAFALSLLQLPPD